MTLHNEILSKFGSTKKIFEALKYPEKVGISRLYKQDKEFFIDHFDTVEEMYDQLKYNCVNFDEFDHCYFFDGILTSIHEKDYWEMVELYQDAIITQYIVENELV